MVPANSCAEDKKLRESETARFLGVSARTLQRWRILRIGPPFLKYSARCIRYREVDLRAWQDAQSVKCV
jgi:hypothetical protein